MNIFLDSVTYMFKQLTCNCLKLFLNYLNTMLSSTFIKKLKKDTKDQTDTSTTTKFKFINY